MIFKGDRLPEIPAERVVMRWLEEADAPEIFRIYSDPEVMKYWSTLPFTELSQAADLIARIHRFFQKRELFEWGMVRRSDDRVIGTFTLFQVDERNRRGEIGFAQARDVWGRGYMRETLTAAFRYAFGPLDLTRLEADVDPRNEPSLRLLSKLGFRREGLLRERWRVGGDVQDSVMLGLLRREWQG